MKFLAVITPPPAIYQQRTTLFTDEIKDEIISTSLKKIILGQIKVIRHKMIQETERNIQNKNICINLKENNLTIKFGLP